MKVSLKIPSTLKTELNYDRKRVNTTIIRSFENFLFRLFFFFFKLFLLFSVFQDS